MARMMMGPKHLVHKNGHVPTQSVQVPSQSGAVVEELKLKISELEAASKKRISQFIEIPKYIKQNVFVDVVRDVIVEKEVVKEVPIEVKVEVEKRVEVPVERIVYKQVVVTEEKIVEKFVPKVPTWVYGAMASETLLIILLLISKL